MDHWPLAVDVELHETLKMLTKVIAQRNSQPKEINDLLNRKVLLLYLNVFLDENMTLRKHQRNQSQKRSINGTIKRVFTKLCSLPIEMDGDSDIGLLRTRTLHSEYN